MKKNKTSVKNKINFLQKAPQTKYGKVRLLLFLFIFAGLGFFALTQTFAYANPFVYYGQHDPAWANSPYPYKPGTVDQSDIKMTKSGCGPTSMAMVAASLSRPARPDQVAAWYGPRFHTSAGTETAVYPQFARDYSLGYASLGSFTSASTRQAIQSRLSSARTLVIVHVGKGIFTTGGHIMVLRDYNAKTNEYLVADPNSLANNRWFTENVMLNGGNIKYAFAFWK